MNGGSSLDGLLSGAPGGAPVQIIRQRLNRRRGALLAATALVAATAFAPGMVRAQDSNWRPNPTSGDFNTATNWNTDMVPTGTAFFGTSSTRALTFSADTTIGGWTFNAGAPAYTFANNDFLDFNGAGIVNGGSATINNNTGGNLNFFNRSTAGSATINNNFNMDFHNNSTAGSTAITNGPDGDLRFDDFSTAGNATITNNNTIFFFGNSTAGNAAITNNSGASVNFLNSTGPAGDNSLTAGSIAGAGSFLLGPNELTVGGNNLSTNVSGVISGILGSLVKVGTGTLTLSGNANLGGTTIDGGTFAVNGGTLNAVNTIIMGSTSGSSGTLNIGAGGGARSLNLIVGESGVGTLAVQNGGTLTDSGGFVGNLSGSQGTVTVSGAGSTWTSTDTIQIGALGTGTLTIQNGGTVNVSGGISVGLSGGSTGTVTVTGPGSTLNNGPGGGLNIGSFSTGSLTIANGGMVINNTAFAADIGNGAGSQGTVTVTGAGSTWSNSSGVNIGDSGTGTLTIADGGIVSGPGPIVIAANAGSIGTLNIGAGAGNAPAAPGTLTASSLAFGAGTGTLNFNHNSADYVFAPAISGKGTVNALAGTTILTGTNRYGGATTVSAGALFVNGDQAGATGATNVAGGATLGGTGTIGGNVSVADGGTLAPGGVGGGIGTLTINGGLGLNSGSSLDYSFGQVSMVGGPLNDLTVVKDNLTLAGTLNVALTPGGVFDPGVYRVISYAGTLTDNGLVLGTVPPGTTEVVQTSVAHQVNLVNTTGVTLDYWDGGAAANKNNGVVDGGTGAWQSSAGNNNWTNAAGALNAPWVNGGFALFEAAPGTVTVDNSLGQVVASGMQFAVGGYTLTGEPVTLVETAAGSGATVVRVGDGTAAGTGMTAIIASVLRGSTQLVKDDLGTLVLSGANTYSGGTAIDGGALQVAADSNLGAATGPLSFNGGTLATTASFISGRATTLDSGGGTFDVVPMTTLTMSGAIDGAGALSKSNAGTLVLTADNTYSGGTAINGGAVQVAADGNLGAATGPLSFNGGTLATTASFSSGRDTTINSGGGTFDVAPSTTLTMSGAIDGTGALSKSNAGALVLTADNTYTGGTTISAGTLQLGGGVSGSIVGDVTDNGVLAFNRSDTVTFPGVISGTGSVSQAGSGTTVLTGTNRYGGATTVSAGALFVNGDQAGATGATNVAGGATLGGTGTIGGNVSVADGGTLAPGGVGGGIGTLTINGGLGLNSGSSLDYSFGQVSMVGGPLNDLTVVKDNLTLAGTLNVALTPGGVFDPGVYRVISYAGTLTDNGLVLGTVPPGTTEVVQTSVAHQVNLVNTTGVTLDYWDGGAAANKNNGVVDGGTGAWQSSAGNDNWTNVAGTLNAPWANAGFATFEAAPGTVTVDNSLGQVVASGMQFAVGGYTLSGAPLTLVETAAGSGATVVRVGDGTAAGTGMTAIIASVLQGSTQLVKEDLGTLVLSGDDTYSGGTAINGGAVQLGDGGTTGSIFGNVTDNGTLAFNRSDTVSFPGVISGNGSLAQIGPGTTILTADNTYTGGTTIAAGTLQLGNGGISGSILRDVADNGTLAFNRSDTVSFPGVISGSGGLAQLGPGTTILTAANTYTGGTTIAAGTLQLGNGGISGSILRDVADNGTLAFNRSDTVSFPGVISGNGSLAQLGPGTTILTADNTYNGGTTIAAGTLQLGNGGISGSILRDVADNGTLAFNRSDTVSFPGVISGNGSLAQLGPGTTILTADNTYTGGTTIAAGTLQLGNGGISGSILRDVADNGTLAFSRSDTVSFPGVISGSGGLAQLGPGTTILTADNTYTGGTAIAAGTLQLGNGGTTGSILGDVADSGTLTVDRSDTVSFPGVISGSGGLAQLGPGTTILTAANTFTGGTTIAAGTLQLGNGGTSGSILGNVTDNGTLAFNRTDTVSFPGVISGSGGLAQLGPGSTILTADNAYTGGTTISAGTLQLGNGGTSGSILGDIADSGTLAFNRNNTVSFPGVISGTGSVSQAGSGTTVLTGTNRYGGATTVSAGALFVNGDQVGATGATNVAGGATLGGTGTIGGNVGVANGGTLAPGGVGGGIGTLTINGGLGLNSGSTLNYSFGQAGVVGGPLNDLTVVKVNLTLAGTLNVALTPGGVFDRGVYRVISYAGTLTDNGLVLGTVPPGTTEVVQTSVAHQVNLVNTTGVTLDYWDGAAAANKNNGVVDGGTGTWQSAAGNNNWTNVAGALNAPWANAGFATFEAAPGTVTVDNSLGQVVASGMQFAVGGYTLTGAPITLVETAAGSGATVVRVGDGTAAGTGMTAIIASVLQGSTQLVKEDLGTLVLSGANTYSGGTAIDGGAVQVAADSNLGAATGPLSFNGGTLATTASFTSGRATTLDSGGGTFDVAPSTTLTMSGAIDGSGALSKGNAGTLVLAADNTYTGGTAIAAGTLQLGTGGTTGSILGNIADSGTLAFDRSDTVTFPGVISGSGDLAQIGPGTTILTAANSYSGATNVNAGSLRAGAPNTFSPNSTVTVAGGGTLDLNGFSQTVSGVTNAGLVNMGTGTAPGTVLATTSYTGAGGTITMNTFLGGDGSPSDKLVINGGSATGNSLLGITNAGGPGAETAANGIAVVQAINGGTTAPGAFQLATATDIEVGPFDYRLFRGGVSGNNLDDWFLRSDFVVPPTPTPTPTPTPPTNPFPSDPPPNPLPPGVYPILEPRLATYGVVQPIARELGLTTLGTLHERIGDTLTLENAGPDAEGWGPSAWGRFIGQQIDNRYQAFADPSAKGQLFGIQAGLDLWRGSLIPGHRDAAGVYFAYLNAGVDVDGLVTNPTATAYVNAHTGTLNLNSYSFGGYWTHYGPGGWYLDAVLQGTRYEGSAAAPLDTLGMTTTLGTRGTGFASSLEAGYPVPLPLGPHFIMEPQAQIIWQHVNFGPANDGLETIALGSTSGTTGRLGVRGQWTIDSGNGAVWQPYGRINLWRDWGGDAATSFSGSPIQVPLVEQATRLEFAGGLTYKFDTNLSYYMQAGYQFAVSPTGARRDGVLGDIGLRLTW